jgi:ketosteroid isomerase-like protein
MEAATRNGAATTPGSTEQQASEAAAWVSMFAEGWAEPVDADHFCDHFEPWFHPEVRMIQPNLRPTVGPTAFREQFARPLFDLVPDLHGTVEGWAVSGESVYIELRLEGTVGRRPFTMRTCDRIKLRDGKAYERVAYLDPAPLLKAVAASPRSWPGFLRSQLRSLRRAA